MPCETNLFVRPEKGRPIHIIWLASSSIADACNYVHIYTDIYIYIDRYIYLYIFACYLLSLRFDLLPLLLCIINSLSMKTNLQPGRSLGYLSISLSLSTFACILLCSWDFPGNLFCSAWAAPLGHWLFNSIALPIFGFGFTILLQ